MAVIKRPRVEAGKKFRSRSAETESDHALDRAISTPAKPISLDDLQQELLPTSGRKCFGCLYRVGKPVNAEKEPEMARLWDFIVANYGVAEEESFANTLSKVQYRLFVKPFEGQEDIPPIWPPEMIREHFTSHPPSVELNLRKDFVKLDRLCDVLLHQTAHVDPNTDAKKFDYESIKTYLAARRDKEGVAARLEGTKRATTR